MAMQIRPFVAIFLCVLPALALPARAAAPQACAAESPRHTVALVELYTSEGCDSCPPADRWLSSLAGRGFGPERVVPIALHVDYWDYIGWKDPYARRAHSGRQRKMAQLARVAMIYTPQVLLQGRDFRGWQGEGFGPAVAGINARPARAAIRLRLDAGDREALQVEAFAALTDAPGRPSSGPDVALFLGAYENKLVSEVQAGENRGRTLRHDYVVLQWAGPFELAGGRWSGRQRLPLLPGAVPAHSGVAAFVQDRASGEVLQALMLGACAG